MVRHYNYTFRFFGKEITASASITDRIEERDYFKPTEASMRILEMLRGFGTFRAKSVHRSELKEVKKRETISRNETYEAMRNAVIEARNYDGIERILLLQAEAYQASDDRWIRLFKEARQ